MKETKTKTVTVNGCKFGKHGIRRNGVYFKAHYSLYRAVGGPNMGKRQFVVYGHSTTGKLPAELNPTNATDGQTDYFESDKLRFVEGSEHFETLCNWLFDLYPEERERAEIEKNARAYADQELVAVQEAEGFAGEVLPVRFGSN